MATSEQLEWEARAARPAATFAFGALFLLIGATILRQSVFADGADNDREILAAVHKNADTYVLSGVVQGLSVLALIGIFFYLYRLIQARNPDFQTWILPLLVAGPILLCAAGILTALHEVDIADKFIDAGAETEKRAEDLREDTQPVAVGLSFGGTFGVAISFVLISMNAMRVGLLTRFMGIIGVLIGALLVIPFLPVFILQFFWFTALGALFLGRWPGGRGPAWETGEAIPWPTPAQRAAAGDEAAGSIPPEPELEAGDAEGESQPKNPRKSKKRKRR